MRLRELRLGAANIPKSCKHANFVARSKVLELGMSPTSVARRLAVQLLDRVPVASGGPGVRGEVVRRLANGIYCLEDEAYRRAVESSDKLMMFLLGRRRPEVPKANWPEGFAIGGFRSGAVEKNNGRSFA